MRKLFTLRRHKKFSAYLREASGLLVFTAENGLVRSLGWSLRRGGVARCVRGFLRNVVKHLRFLPLLLFTSREKWQAEGDGEEQFTHGEGNKVKNTPLPENHGIARAVLPGSFGVDSRATLAPA
jgi:hypothetical protein